MYSCAYNKLTVLNPFLDKVCDARPFHVCCTFVACRVQE